MKLPHLLNLLLVMLLTILLPASAARPLTSGEDLMRQDGQIYVAPDAVFPAARSDIGQWRQARAAVSKASLFGGADPSSMDSVSR